MAKPVRLRGESGPLHPVVTTLDSGKKRGLVDDSHIPAAVGNHDGQIGRGRHVDESAQIGVMGSPGSQAQVVSRLGPVRVDSFHDGMGEDELQLGDPFNEFPHVIVDRIRDDLLGGADLHDPPVLHDRDPAADPDRLVQIVGDEHRGLVELRGERHELLLELATDQGVEGGERLVHQQYFGIGGERPGEPHPLLHPARELAREPVLVTLQIDEAEAALGDLPALRFRLALHLQRKRDVVPHRAVRKERHVLEHHADMGRAELPQLALAKGQDIPSQHLDASGGRLDQPIEMAHHRRLARAREPHDAEDLSARDLERAIRDADHAFEALEHLGLGEPLVRDRPHRLFDPRAEDLPHSLQPDDGFTHLT